MKVLEVRPVDVFVNVSPKVKILLPDYWVEFSPNYPSSLDYVRGKTFRIVKNQQVFYPITRVIKEACYLDLNFSNEEGAEQLYPENSSNLYEVLIGLKAGNYFIHIYFPADQPIYRLDDPDMSPLISSATYKYLGAIKPEDSPTSNPTFKLHFIYRLNPVILRIYATDGVAWEKVTLELLINKCLLEEGSPPSGVKPKYLEYMDRLKW